MMSIWAPRRLNAVLQCSALRMLCLLFIKHPRVQVLACMR